MADTCCPLGMVYVDDKGNFSDPAIGSGTIISYTGPIPSSYNKCVFIQSGGYAYGGPIDPITCPCCPQGYTYSSVQGSCIDPSNPRNQTTTIPCIVCNCVATTPFTCPGCGTSGIGINYNFDFNSKQCVDCVPDTLAPIKGNLGCFLPLTYTDPNILGFKLKQ